MSDDLLDRIEQEPPDVARASVIWLHGLGDTGHGWSAVVPELGVQDELGARFIFPHASQRPVTINAGIPMPAWYDIRHPGEEDEAGVRESERLLRALVDHEVSRGIAPEKIVVAGFSQGGAIALQTGLRHPERLAGILGLSTRLAIRDTLADEVHEANREVPIFLAHGTLDPVIPVTVAEASKALLEDLGYRVSWNTYPIEHSWCDEESKHVAAWLREVLG